MLDLPQPWVRCLIRLCCRNRAFHLLCHHSDKLRLVAIVVWCLTQAVEFGKVPTTARSAEHKLCKDHSLRQPRFWLAQVLLQALLQVDPAQRLTAAQVCAHPWVLGLPPLTFCITVDGRSPGPHMPAHAAAAGSGAGDSVEGTLQAMQRLWLQQPPPFQGVLSLICHLSLALSLDMCLSNTCSTRPHTPHGHLHLRL